MLKVHSLLRAQGCNPGYVILLGFSCLSPFRPYKCS
nr:MAG TPA_asm: hypothetical protein [Caudoviricetes sp.]